MTQATSREVVELDLRKSPSQTVVYLEGKTDVELLLALLGNSTVPGDVSKGILARDVLVKPCGGSNAVRALVDVASSFHHSGQVFGILDGDGLPLRTLAANFDAPYPGPLFTWKTYCIENLLVKTGWPSAWGTEPDWRAVFLSYGPYVALNRIHSTLVSALKTLGIAQFANPPRNSGPLRTHTEMIAALEAGKHLIRDFDAVAEFGSQLSAFELAVDRDIDEAHALINGKWLLEHMAPTITKRGTARCQFEWLAHARSVGGLPEVREWWERVTGNPP